MSWVDVRTKKIGKSAILMLSVLASVYTLTYYTDRGTGLITPEDHYILSAGLAERVLAHSNGDLTALEFVDTDGTAQYGTNYTAYNIPLARIAYNTKYPEYFDDESYGVTIASLIKMSARAKQWSEARHWILKDNDFATKVNATILEPITFAMSVNAGVVNFSGYDLNFLCFGNLSRDDDYYYYNYWYARQRMSWLLYHQGGYDYYRPFVNIMAGYFGYVYTDEYSATKSYHDRAIQKPVTYNGDSTITNWWNAIGNTNKTYSFTFQNSTRWQYIFANPTEYAAAPRYIFGTKDFLIEAEQFLQSLNCIAFVDSAQTLTLSVTNYIGKQYKYLDGSLGAYNSALLTDVGIVFTTLQTEPSYVGEISRVNDGVLHTARYGSSSANTFSYSVSASTYKREEAEEPWDENDPLDWRPYESSCEIEVRIPVPKFKTVEPTTLISQALVESGVISKVHVFAPFSVQGDAPVNYGEPSLTTLYRSTPYNEGGIFTSMLESTLTEPYEYVSGSLVNPYTIKYEGVDLSTVSYPTPSSLLNKFVKIATIEAPTSTNDLRIAGSNIDVIFGVDESAATTLDVGFGDLNEKHTESSGESETLTGFARITNETITRSRAFTVHTSYLFYIVEFDFEFFNPDPAP